VKSPSWLLFLWILASLLQIALCVFIVKRKLLKTWPTLFTACAVEVIASCILKSVEHRYKLYFHVYWIYVAVQALLRLCVIGDLIRAIPKFRFMPGDIRKTTLILACIAAALAICFAPHHETDAILRDTVLWLNYCVYAAWGSIIVVLLAGLAASGFGMTLTGARIASGFILLILSSMAASLAYVEAGHYPAHARITIRLTANGVDSCVVAAVTAYWIYSLLERNTESALSAAEQLEVDKAFASISPRR
jgi:hypothetical protein